MQYKMYLLWPVMRVIFLYLDNFDIERETKIQNNILVKKDPLIYQHGRNGKSILH